MIVVLFWDGLRPEFVRESLTPNLCELIQTGVHFANHHAVFPTETRVNATSTATGCYPGTHGIVGNQVFIPEVKKDATLNTGNHEDLMKISYAENLVAVPTLARILKQNGKSYAIYSSGSPGSSWLQCEPSDGTMINVRGVIHPPRIEETFHAQWDGFPEETVPAHARNSLLTQLLVDTIRKKDVDVLFGWYCDPDFTQHKVGLGEKTALEAISQNDQYLGQILSVIEGSDLIVTSDHGFSTLSKPFDLAKGLVDAGFHKDQWISTGNGIHLVGEDKNLLPKVVDFLAQQDWVGPIFTKGMPKSVAGRIDGTFSFDAIQLDHWRTPDVVFSRRWSDLVNEYGVPGFTYGSSGIASHGTCSPFDLSNVLVASGPNFKKNERSIIPSGITDLAPTIQHLVFGEQLQRMDGRVLFEGLAGSKTLPTSSEAVLKTQVGSRAQYLQVATVGTTRYISKGWVED